MVFGVTNGRFGGWRPYGAFPETLQVYGDAGAPRRALEGSAFQPRAFASREDLPGCLWPVEELAEEVVGHVAIRAVLSRRQPCVRELVGADLDLIAPGNTRD